MTDARVSRIPFGTVAIAFGLAGLADVWTVAGTASGLPASIAAAEAGMTAVAIGDGNGRTGRALMQTMLHRLGVTRNLTAPVSAGLLRDTGGCFDALTAYRAGDVAPIIRELAGASLAAVVNGRQLVADLTDVRAGWERIACPRAGSAGRRLLDMLQRQPIIDAKLASDSLGISARNAQGGIDRLVEDGILQ